MNSHKTDSYDPPLFPEYTTSAWSWKWNERRGTAWSEDKERARERRGSDVLRVHLLKEMEINDKKAEGITNETLELARLMLTLSDRR